MKLYLFNVARKLQQVYGTRFAADYLCRNKVSVEAACWILLRK